MLHGSITQSHGSMICSNAVEESPGPPKAHGTHRTLGHAVRNRNENPSRRRKAQKKNSSDLAQQRGANDTGGNVKPLQHQFSVKPQPRTTDYCPLTEPLYPNRTLQLLRSGQFTHSLRGLFNMLVEHTPSGHYHTEALLPRTTSHPVPTKACLQALFS